MLWIKEVEMVDSVDELKSSRSIAGKNSPNFDMLDAKIASALKKVIQNSHFKKKVGLEEQKAQKEDRFLRGRQIAYMIYDYFRVTVAHDTVLDYADLFSVTVRNDNVREFDTRWDENLLVYDQDPAGWCSGKSVQIENTWVWSTPNCICMSWKFIRRYRWGWRQWWREVQIRNFDCEILTPDIWKSKQVQWLRVTED